MPRMITVLEDCVRYRDGKKWKRRHCFLAKSDSKKRSVTMFITKQFGISVTNQEIDEKSLRQYLIDEITGFEHGRHVDKESHVMALIGCNVVYCIAFEQTDTMFRWAETLSKLLTSVHFHVTLKKVSDTSTLFNKITVGTQGNLHVQHSRLCLIGEPADGNKFICEWSVGNLISLDVHDTKCDKMKLLQIRSNGKSNKGKGHFEFEVSLTQITVFEDALRTFITTCNRANVDFATNYPLLPESNDDNSYSYSIICKDKTGSNSENSSSLEKRSSEIPIPRSREHSGPDQRPIENVQVKMRKLQKNLQKVEKEPLKPYSTIGTVNKHDNDACLFPDDEEIEDLVQHKSQNFLLRALSQESSGVCVSGPSDSLKDVDLSVNVSGHDDSGYANFSSNPHNQRSTSSCHHHHDIDNHNVLPQCRQKHCKKISVFSNFYREICRNPLSLNNYRNYHRLLKTVFEHNKTNNSQTMKRSNSFSCVHIPDMKRFEFCRKYSNVNFPLNVANKLSEQQSRGWKEKLSRENIEAAFLGMNFTPEIEDLSELSLSNRLPFRSMKEFHGAMMRSYQSGTMCFNMFSYHHFLSLLNDTRTVMKNIVTSSNAATEYRNLKDLISRKSKVYNHWLERIQSYCSSCDETEPSVIDVNILLVFQIMDSVIKSRTGLSHGLLDEMSRHQSYFNTNELNDAAVAVSEHLPPKFLTDNPMFMTGTRPLLTMSSSTPDFRHYSHHERVHKLSDVDTHYQNLSSLDTFDVDNNSFSKYGNYPNKTATLDSKEGSFKRFRRKCSPNVIIPFIRRKTSSIQSTVSEPMYNNNDTKEQNCYYNISNHRNIINKKSLSVVLDSCQYVNVSQSSKSFKASKNSKKTLLPDYSDYANIDPSLGDDNTNYPDEIMDPSRNYGDLNFIKGRMRFSTRHHSDSQNWPNLRRSSLSILSQKSLQNYGTSSHSRRGHSTVISRVHSDACTHDNGGARFRSTDYINTKALSTSPLSLQSCCAGEHKQRTVPRSLNYVTVVEHSARDRFTLPLQVLTSHDHDSAEMAASNHDNHSVTHRPPPANHSKRSWLTPQSSPIVDYCQIDLNGTYALRDIDQQLRDKKSNGPTLSHDPLLLLHSFPSLENIPRDVYHSLTRPPHHKTKYASTKSIRRMFSRKCPDTSS